jgi:tetratricopeptide (TPR) repeat protein
MAKKTVTRKQLLKEPDQFITFSGKLIAFGREHAKAITIGAGSILAVILIVVLAGQISDRNENKASARVEKVLADYTAALQDTNAETAYDRVKPEFEAIFDSYGSKNAAKLARIVYGDISFNAGDADTAIAVYQRALDDFSQKKALKILVLNGLGHAHAHKGQYPESIRYFEMILEESQHTMKSEALFQLAWLYEATGEKEKSNARYEQLRDDFPDSMYAELVKEKTNS